LFVLFNGVARIIRQASGHNFDAGVYICSGSDITAGFAYVRDLITIDNNSLFSFDPADDRQEPSSKDGIKSWLEWKFRNGMHGGNEIQGFRQYALELILLRADLDSLVMLSEDKIEGDEYQSPLVKTVVEFKINGEVYRHTHFKYIIPGDFIPENKTGNFLKRELADLLRDKKIILLFKAGAVGSYEALDSIRTIYPLLPEQTVIVSDVGDHYLGDFKDELIDLKTPEIVKEFQDFQGAIPSREDYHSNSPYLSYGYATDLGKDLGVFRKVSPLSSPGGIDFRRMPVSGQPLLKPLPTGIGGPLAGINIKQDEEWLQIQKMIQAGIIPSNERIKEYFADCCGRDNMNQEMDKIIVCVAEILKLEEERCMVTSEGIKDFLVLLESNKPADEIQALLKEIDVSTKEQEFIGEE